MLGGQLEHVLGALPAQRLAVDGARATDAVDELILDAEQLVRLVEDVARLRLQQALHVDQLLAQTTAAVAAAAAAAASAGATNRVTHLDALELERQAVLGHAQHDVFAAHALVQQSGERGHVLASDGHLAMEGKRVDALVEQTAHAVHQRRVVHVEERVEHDYARQLAAVRQEGGHHRHDH